MLPKWKRLKGNYVLKIQRLKNTYFLSAGSHDDGSGESRAYAQTTPRISEAMGFETINAADRMRILLNERYGLEAQIMERKMRQNDD